MGGIKLVRSFIALLIVTVLLVMEPGSVNGAHFQLTFQPAEKEKWCDFLGKIRLFGIDAKPGDEVGFFDRHGVLYGTAILVTAGQYGYVHVYGGEGEGPQEGDPLTVRVWEAGRSMEWKNGCIVLAAGEPLGNNAASVIPPVWSSSSMGYGYVLNIDTQMPSADLNGDCDITIADAILSLRITSAVSEPGVSPTWTGVDDNRQIGLREAVYILQKVAGIRR